MFWPSIYSRITRSAPVLLGLIALVTAVSCGGDGDDYDEDEPAAAAPTQAPAIPATSPRAPGQPSSSASAAVSASDDLPRLTTQVDVLFTDLNTGQIVFEIETEAQFSESPTASIIPLEGSPALEDMIRANLKWLDQRGYTEIEVYGVEGDGAVYFDSQLLASLRHEGFDYDKQYKGSPEEDDLRIDKDEARGRFYWTGNMLPDGNG